MGLYRESISLNDDSSLRSKAHGNGKAIMPPGCATRKGEHRPGSVYVGLRLLGSLLQRGKTVSEGFLAKDSAATTRNFANDGLFGEELSRTSAELLY